jgi:hypothetical protein
VYGSAARHNALPGQHGERWPVWSKEASPAAGKPPVSWLLGITGDGVQVDITPSAVDGRIISGPEFGSAPGNVTVRFPKGREFEIGQAMWDAVEAAFRGKDPAMLRAARHRKASNPPPPAPPQPKLVEPPPADDTEEAAKQILRVAAERPAPAQVLQAAAERSNQASQARAAGDEFFTKLESRPVKSETEETDDVPDFFSGASQIATRDTEPPPPPSAAPSPPPITKPVASAGLPQCTCPPAVKGSGAHAEGCPAEDIPPGMLQ